MTPLLPAFTGTPQPNRIYNADVLTFLRAFDDNSVDLFFADPPYNLGYEYQVIDDNRPDHQYYEWCNVWLDEARRILKPTGSLFVMNIPKHAVILAAHLHQTMRFQHWITWKAASRRSNKALMPEHYALLWYSKTDTFTANEIRAPHKRCRSCNELIADYGGKKHLIHPYGPQISDVWTDIGRAKHNQRGEHPCKLPEKFARRVIALASNPGAVVVDPFVGAGTSAIAAQQLGRDYVGNDLNIAYVEMARQALAIPAQMPLFAHALA